MRGVSSFTLIVSISMGMVLGRSVDVRESVDVERMERCVIDGKVVECRLLSPPTSTVDEIEDGSDLVWIDNITPLDTVESTALKLSLTASASVTSQLGSQPTSEPEPEPVQDPEDSLASQYPPSNRPRRWGMAIGFFALFTLISLIYVYRSSLPFSSSSVRYAKYNVPSLPNLKYALPTLASIKYSLFPSSVSSSPSKRTHRKSKSSKSSFRPSPSSLLRWAREDRPTTDFFVGDLEDGEGDYEQVGLLPSPSPYRSNFAVNEQGQRGNGNGELREQRSYGSISGRS